MQNNEEISVKIEAEKVVCIDKYEYDELLQKAHSIDIIKADICMSIEEGKKFSYVDEDLVMLVTGMKAYLNMKNRKEAARIAARQAEASGKDEAGE